MLIVKNLVTPIYLITDFVKFYNLAEIGSFVLFYLQMFLVIFEAKVFLL